MVSTMFKEAAAALTGAGAGGGEHYSRLIRELFALLVAIISHSAAPVAPSPSQHHQATGPTRLPRSTTTGVSPAAAASMLLGASMALMLCGSVMFAIGFLLVPWVAGIAMLLGFAAAVSALSTGVLGKGAARGRVPSSLASPASDKPVVV